MALLTTLTVVIVFVCCSDAELTCNAHDIRANFVHIRKLKTDFSDLTNVCEDQQKQLDNLQKSYNRQHMELQNLTQLCVGQIRTLNNLTELYHEQGLELTQLSQLCKNQQRNDDADDYKFFMGFLSNHNENLSKKEIFITAREYTTVNISAPNLGLYKTGLVKDVMKVTLPANITLSPSTGIYKTGVLVEAAHSITVHAWNYMSTSTDGTYLFPKSQLRRNYLISSYGNGTSSDPAGLAVIGTVDNTTVTIEVKGLPPKVVVLNRLEEYQFTSKADLTGTFVTATETIAVFAGDVCTLVQVGALDHQFEQMPPVESLEKAFVVSNFSPRNDIVLRITAAYNNTLVTRSDGIAISLQRGETSTSTVTNQILAVTSNNGIQVAMFDFGSTSDGSMLIVPALCQFKSEYKFVVPDGFDINKLMITFPIYMSSNDVRLNDVAVHPNETHVISVPGYGEYAVFYLDVQEGGNTVISTNGHAFGGYLYGLGSYNSYLWSLGSNLFCKD